jgi:very-short-patch-repair endonuclease
MAHPTTERARELRRNMSPVERRLWSRLRRLRDRGFHFRRQAPLRGYFLDFACFTRRLVVEIDGGQHSDECQAAHDALRDRVLEREGFKVMRFWASEVWRDLDGVVDRIVLAAEARPDTRAPSLNAEGGRGEAEVGWCTTDQNAESADDPHFPTLIASRSVPPH